METKITRLKPGNKWLKYLLSIAGFCIALLVTAQNGEIYGVIKDASTNDVLPGAAISLQGTSIGTVTNMGGEYRISNISPGKYTVSFSFIGFLSEDIDIELTPGETERIDINMVLDAVSLGEVVVTAQMLGQAKAINQQLNSDALVSVVSQDKIQELPDATAAEAIGRLPGIAVQRSGGEATKVTVRGLSPKLTSVTINGVKVGATSISQSTNLQNNNAPTVSDDRSVDLSMISPELLSSIEVFKSPTADMDGDAIGGVVNLGISKAPLKPVTKIKINGGYSGLTKEFANYKTSIDVSKRLFNDKFGVMARLGYENTDRSTETFTQSYNQTDVLDEPYNVTSGSIEFTSRVNQRLGGSLNLDYQYNSGFVVGQVFSSGVKNNIQTWNNNLNEGGRVNHTSRYSQNLTSNYNAVVSGQQRIKLVQIDWTLAKSGTTDDNMDDHTIRIGESAGIAGVGKAYRINDLLDRRTYNYAQAVLDFISSEPDKTYQDNTTAALDFKIDYSMGDYLGGFIKFGGKYRADNRERINNHRYIRYDVGNIYEDRAVQNMLPDVLMRSPSGDILIDNFINSYDYKYVFGNDLWIAPGIDMDAILEYDDRQKNEYRIQYDRLHENYDLTERVYAAYIMSKVNIGKAISLIPGLRYEYSDNEYNSVYNTHDREGQIGMDSATYTERQYGILLPGLHVKVKPVPWFDVRMSAVKTLSRPDYSMITPRTWVDGDNGRIFKTNPQLKPAEAWSYDAFFSFFSNKFGLITFGGFYKEIDNYFTGYSYSMSRATADSLGYPSDQYSVEQDYINFNGTRVYGFEIDMQTNFSYLPGALSGIVLSANLTRLWSETYAPKYNKVTYYDRVTRSVVIDYEKSYMATYKSFLPDQVKLAGNVSLGYDYKGFSSRISMIYQAPSLQSISGTAESDSLTNPVYFENYNDLFVRFDASLSQKIGEHFTVYINLINLNGANEVRYRYMPVYRTREHRYGASFDLGIQYKF
ncbi:MAG: TonB-dependent receptor [Bacteroidales bacterium]|nr:TonB-dependent receptor [Bacteroidales bacterium]